MTIQETILAASGSPAVSTLVKAAIVAVGGLCAVLLAYRSRAAARHALLAATFAVLAALPVATVFAPPLQIVLRVARSTPPPVAPAAKSHATVAATSSQAAQSPAAQGARLSVDQVLLAVWLAGALLFLFPVFFGLRQVNRLRRTALPWREGQPLLDRLAETGGIRRPVALLLQENLAGPMSCGIVRPAIVLPIDAPSWETADLDRAIVHELEHVGRRDWLIHCLSRVVSAIYWCIPIVWIARRRLELEAERACYDAVLERSEATTYADQLVALARRLSASGKAPQLAMASRADLSARVAAILDSRQRRGRAGAWRIVLTGLAAITLLAAVSPLRVVAAPQPAAAGRGLPNLRSETALVMVDVGVSYPNGAGINGLTAGDFTVTEDDAPQVISVFEAQKSAGGSAPSHYLLGYYARPFGPVGGTRQIHVAVKTATTATLEYRTEYVVGERADVPPVATTDSLPPGVRPPVLIYKKEPEYSEAARKAKFQGSVMLQVQVDESGRVAGARVLRALGLGLDEKAHEAVLRWRFRPATKDGQPVSVKAIVQVTFRLL